MYVQFCNEAKSCAYWLVNKTLWYEIETFDFQSETRSRPRPSPISTRPRRRDRDYIPAGNTHSATDWSCFKSLRNKYHYLILTAKKHYYSNLVSLSFHNPKRLWQTVNNLLHHKSSSPLPSSAPGVLLADGKCYFPSVRTEIKC